MTESMAKPKAGVTSRASKSRTSRAPGNSATVSRTRFSAKLFRPVTTAKAAAWTFLTLPKQASARLPSRGMTSVEGTFNGVAFAATLEIDLKAIPSSGNFRDLVKHVEQIRSDT